MGDTDSDLERTNQALLRKLAQAEIAIDQLRVARYVARKRTFNTQSTGTVQAVQTDDPELVDAVEELETEIEESVPLFVTGEDPIDDLQQLLQGMQGSFVHIERKSDSASSILTDRVDGCKDKLDKMESALALKILDTSRAASSTSRGSSRAGSRCGRKSGANSVHGRSSCSGASGELNNGVCNTSSLLTGDLNSRDTSFDNNGELDVSTEFDTFLEDEERRMSSLHNSEFERDELLCKSESKSSLTELAELHESARSDSGHSGELKRNNSLVQFLKRANSKKSEDEDAADTTLIPKKTTNFCCFPLSASRRKKHKRSKSAGDKYKRCISVISDGTQTAKYEVSNVADYGVKPTPYVAKTSSFTVNNDAPSKLQSGGLVRSQNNSNDSALGSSLSQKRDKRRYSTPNTKELSIGGSVTSLAKPPLPGSTSNHSISSSVKNTMFCTPLSEDLGIPKEPVTDYKGTRGYDYAPSYNEHELEFDNMFDSKPGHKSSSRRSSHNSHSLYENIDQFEIAEPVKPPVPEHVPIIQRKRATPRSTKSDETTPGYDSGYQDDSRRSSPNRTGSTGAPAPDTRHRTLSTKSDISGVRDDVQELASRLRDLRSSIRSSSRSSSPSIPHERAQTTREALRERLRQLQCSPGVGLDVPEQRAARRSASPQRLADPQELLNRSYPSYGPARSHTYRMACPPPSMPSAPHSSSRNGSRSGSPRIARRTYPEDNTRSPRSRSPCSHYSERDTRHMFYDVDHGQSRAYTPPLEVGVRIGSNIDMMQRQTRDIEQIRTQSLQSVEAYNRKYR